MSAKFQGMKIGLASPETILKWSKGEVTKPETVNYKTIKPEKDGLFCQKIFGPEKDYECACGKYKKIKNKGKVCERCGVEITESIVRRERMGHVKLACPITHTWLLFKRDRIISRILNIKQKNLEKIVYFQAHVVLSQPEIDYPTHVVEKERIHHRDVLEFTGEENEIVLQSRKKTMHILLVIMGKHPVTSEVYAEARRYYELISNQQIPTFSIDQIMNFIQEQTGLKTGTGSEAVLSLLEEFDGQKITTEIATIKNQISNSLSPTTRTTARFDANKLKRLKILNAFDQQPNSKRRNLASWMVLRVLPVIPPDLRPIIQLDGGRFTTSDLNNLYRRIIIRNERLKKLQVQRAPSIIVNNEKRLLQEAVDALFDNGHLAKTKKVKGREGRPLKSLADLLAGKEGRFRQNLLGKRVDYSGRSVIVVGPELKMYQCGLPAEMAITLFRPFLLNRLISSEIAKNIKVAENMIEVQDARIWPIVNQIAKERPVLLNRAPTLHRLGIQAFEPKIINSKAIRLHPLVCTAFNADFDGDQMAVHVPISDEAVAEARSIMLASWHILSPKDGQPIVAPSLDMVLGLYYLTLEVHGKRGEGMIFRDAAEAIIAHQANQVDIHAIVAVATRSYWHKGMPSNQYIITSLGKILLNESLPKDFPYVTDKELAPEVNPRYLVKGGEDVRAAIANYQPGPGLKKADIGRLVKKVNDVHQVAVVAQFLDKLKDLGFKYSTKSGVTFSIFDIPAIPGKITQVESLENFIIDVRRLFRQGKVTQWERFRLINDKWFGTRRYFEKEIVKIFEQNKTNPIVMMADSGARSNISNFMQLAGLRGLMLNAQGETIEIPIKSSFIDGLTISEVFISTFGARKGMTDIALNTSRSGFLTRRFIDGSQDIIVKEADCGTPFGLVVSDFYDQSNTLIETFKERVLGRYLIEDLRDSRDRVLISADEMITEQNFARMELAKVKSVVIRSPVHCRAIRGICQKCYGLDLSTNARVEIGTPVGILASQSLGEPSTQLTMRTFHGGGIKSGSDISQGLEEVIKVFDAVTGLKDINYDKYVQYNTTNLRRHKNNPQVYIDLMEFITKSLKSFIVVKGNREIQWSKFSYIYGKVTRIRKFNYTPQLVSELWALGNPRAKSNEILQNIKIHVDDQLLNREFFEITIRNNLEEQRYYTFDHVVKEGDQLQPGSAISKGRVVWDLLTKIAGVNKVVEQLHAIPQRIYKLNGIDVCDKYMEIMIKKMTGYMIVVNPSPESNVLPGSNISVAEFKRINKQLLLNNQKPIYGIPTIVGLLWTWEYAKEKFFSAMSYIYTSLVLVDAAINERVDPMEGIKENVALGDLIPVGTALLTPDQVKQNGDYWVEQQY